MSSNKVAYTANTKLAPIALGLMHLTATPHPVPDEQAFETIKVAADASPPGTKLLLNSSEFYDNNLGPGNLELLARFFEKYPDYADKTFLSVKGGAKPNSLEFDGSPENIRRSVDTVLKALRGTKRVDLFECARIADNVPLETIIGTLNELVKEGKFDYIGLSEVGAETVKRAVKIAPIASVEIEVSLWAYEEETRKVIATAKELGIAVHAYSPIGRGFLTGKIQSADDFPDGDYRKGLTRFQPGYIEQNRKLVEAAKKFADKKGVTPTQLAIAWVISLGDHVIPLPGTSRKERVLENFAAADIEFTKEELDEIDVILKENEVKGGRYVDEVGDKALHLWA